MPNYRYAQSYVTRGSGNVVAAAAYQAAENLHSEALAHAAYQAGEQHGRHFNFTRKAHGVLHKGILAPEGAPEWVHDRQELWNRADAAERRGNARLARKLVISLPGELTPEQNKELLTSFLKDRFVSQGMVADFAIHAPDHDADERHVHAHVLLTRRELSAGGFGKLFREAEQGRALYLDRKALEQQTNRALEQAGVQDRVSADSLYARGIVREPEPVLGDKAVEEQRRGQHSRRGTLDDGTRTRLDRVAAVRMRNQLRAEHDQRGEPHPLWLMQYYWQGRDRWMQRQGHRIERVRAKGNIYFAAKLERDFAQARENAARVDGAYFSHPASREAAWREARDETSRDDRAEERKSGRVDERSPGSRGAREQSPKSSHAPAPRAPSGLFGSAGASITEPGGGKARKWKPGTSGVTPRPHDVRERDDDPALNARGNRRDTGDGFVLFSMADQFAADMRSSFPFRTQEEKQGKDFHEHPQTSRSGEERRLRHPGEPEGPAQPGQPAPERSSLTDRENRERER